MKKNFDSNSGKLYRVKTAVKDLKAGLAVLAAVFLLLNPGQVRPASAAWTNANPAVEDCSSEDGWSFSEAAKIGLVDGQVQLKLYEFTGWVKDNFEAPPMEPTETLTLTGISMVDATHGWACGYTEISHTMGSSQGIIFRYDGTIWTEDDVTGTPPDYFYGISMVNATHGWACGSDGKIFKYDGTDWEAETVTGAPTSAFRGISMVDATHGWACGSNGKIFRYESWTWSLEATVTPVVDLYGISMVSLTNGRVCGSGGGGPAGKIFKYDGAGWAEETVGSPPLYFFGISMTDDAVRGWAASSGPGGSTVGGIFKYDYAGADWETDTVTGTPPTYFQGISMVDSTHGWAAGGRSAGKIFKYNGTDWAEEILTGTPPSIFLGISMVDETHGWVCGGSRTYPDAAETIYRYFSSTNIYSPETVTATTPTLNASDLSDFDGWDRVVITASGTDGGTLTIQPQYQYTGSDWTGYGTCIITTTGANPISLSTIPVLGDGGDKLRFVISMTSDYGTERCFDVDNLAVYWKTPATPAPAASISCPLYANTSAFPVSWSGGGEVNRFNVDFKIDSAGAWTRWLSGVSYATKNFGEGGSPVTLADGNRYYFRVQGYSSGGSGESSGWNEAANSTLADFAAPTTQVVTPARSNALEFPVVWAGSDSGSGVASYDVQYKTGPAGSWSDWYGLTALITATFGAGSGSGTGTPITTQDGKTYYFRTRARDNAGNLESWPESAYGQSETMIVLGSEPDITDPSLFGKVKEGLSSRTLRNGDIFANNPPALKAYLPVYNGAATGAGTAGGPGRAASAERIIYDPATIFFYLNGSRVWDGDSDNAGYDHYNSWTGEARYTPKNRLMAGTYSLTVLATEMNGETMTPIAISGLQTLAVGTEAGLAEGTVPLTWPHPFNPEAGALKFTYTLTVATDVVIKVMDTDGTVVWQKLIASGSEGGSTGYNETSWDGRTDWGETVSNGIYLYLIEARGLGAKVIGKGKIVVLR